MKPFRFGVNVGRAGSQAGWMEKARKLEDLGYSALTVPDHLADLLAPMPALVSAAAATTRLRVGTNVINNDFRHPILVACEAATVDFLTDGRLQLGLDAGHMQSEYDFPPVISFPKPVQQPHPPIYIGAFGMGHVFRRVVTYGNAWMPWMFTPEQIRQGRAILSDRAREVGRDPRSIEVVAMPVPAEPDVVKAYEDAGADGVVALVMPATEQEMVRDLEQIAQKLLS
jgi:alkanesulfonate monooxygenase SsuD/methylene tetrahydromethanopterin reductase-like flavin-dependent oxidoreductase (luciferase family)